FRLVICNISKSIINIETIAIPTASEDCLKKTKIKDGKKYIKTKTQDNLYFAPGMLIFIFKIYLV
ncbi:hypothetical protein, partial [Klebsiella pneumoniae]